MGHVTRRACVMDSNSGVGAGVVLIISGGADDSDRRGSIRRVAVLTRASVVTANAWLSLRCHSPNNYTEQKCPYVDKCRIFLLPSDWVSFITICAVGIKTHILILTTDFLRKMPGDIPWELLSDVNGTLPSFYLKGFFNSRGAKQVSHSLPLLQLLFFHLFFFLRDV